MFIMWSFFRHFLVSGEHKSTFIFYFLVTPLYAGGFTRETKEKRELVTYAYVQLYALVKTIDFISVSPLVMCNFEYKAFL